MLNTTVNVLVITISSLILVDIFGRKKKSRMVKIAMLIIGNAGIFFVSQSLPKEIILFVLLAVFDILALVKIFSKENPNQEQYNSWHDNSENWKAGIFYFNKNDRRIFVPKRIEGLGWTINFANATSILAFLIVLALMLMLIKRIA